MYLRKCLVLVYGAMVIPFVGISADNVNVALHKPVIASSQQKEFPASNVTDGVISRNSSWTSAKGARTPKGLPVAGSELYVTIGMVPDQMSFVLFSPDNVRVILRILSRYEKSSYHSPLLQSIQKLFRILRMRPVVC